MAREEDLDYQRKIKDESVDAMNKIVQASLPEWCKANLEVEVEVDMDDLVNKLFDAIKRGEIPHIKIDK